MKVCNVNILVSEKKIENFNSLLLSFLVAYNLIIVVISYSFNTNTQLTPMYYAFLFISAIIVVFLKKTITINFGVLFFGIYVFLYMLLSHFFAGIEQKDYIINFIVYGIFSLYIGGQKVNSEKVLRNLIYISFSPLFVYKKIINLHLIKSIYGSRFSMGISYAILPVVLASLLHFVFYRKKSNVIIRIGYVVNFIYLFLLISLGTRGSIFSIFIFFVMMFVIRPNKKGRKRVANIIKENFIVFFTIIIFFFIILNFQQIVFNLSSIFSQLGINLSFLEKTVALFDTTGDGTNGRIALWQYALKGIMEKPFLGNSFGTFDIIMVSEHPHNFILELLYQGGIFFALPFIIILFRGFKKNILSAELDIYVLSLLVFSSSIPRLLISNTIWRNPLFWLNIAFAFIDNKDNCKDKGPQQCIKVL